MAIEIKAPAPFTELSKNRIVIFAGGSIEMGTAAPWQAELVRAFEDSPDVVILNPRRDDWDSTWKQDKDCAQFREQVEWELSGMETATIIIMYFDPATKSPISLLETGLFAFQTNPKDPKLHVICPDGFWRKGNVDIVCERYGIPQFPSLAAAIESIRSDFWFQFLRKV